MTNQVRISIPFSYTVEGRVGRMRSTTRQVVRDWSTFAIPSATSNEAPVVGAVVGQRAYEKRRGEAWPGDRAERDAFRVFEGRIYVPIRSVFREAKKDEAGGRIARRVKSPLPLKRFEHDLREGALWPVLYGDGENFWQASSLPKLPNAVRDAIVETPELRSALAKMASDQKRAGEAAVVSEDREASMQVAAVSYADGLLVVDGEMWTTTLARESYYVVRVERKSPVVRLELVSGPVGISDVPFRLDRREEAVSFGRGLVESRKGWTWVETPDYAEVERPDLLLLDDAVLLARAVLDNANEKERPSWLPQEARERLDRLAEVARQEVLDPASVGQVLDDAVEVVGAVPIPSPSPFDPFSLNFLANVAPMAAHWREERSNRPDIDAGHSGLDGDEDMALLGMQ